MKQRAFAASAVSLAVVILFVAAPPADCQDGKLQVRVNPKTGYVLLDGRSMGQGKVNARLAPGDYRVQVVRYGRVPFDQTATVTAGQTTKVQVALDALGDTVSGPWGRIRPIVRPNKAAIYLNGRSPEFLIGCVCTKEIYVRPGTHQIAIAFDGYLTYTGSVTVAENEAAEIRLTMAPGAGEEAIPETAITTKPEPKLANVTSTFRETNNRVAIAPLSTQFAVTPSSLRCGDSARLTWNTSESRLVEISDLGPVAASGEQLITPIQTTTYTLRATGPGGTETVTTTVNVDAQIRVNLSVSPASIAIETLDGQETKRESATLSWTVDNASTAEISGLGSVSAAATRALSPDQSTSYTLKATNACGATETLTASLEVKHIDRVSPPVLVQPGAPGAPGAAPGQAAVQLGSIFFPTDYPDERDPGVGLVRSQARTVEQLAQGFREYLKVNPAGKLRLEAHADERRSIEYNLLLSERRGAIIKQRLVGAGIPEANLEVMGFGEEQPLQPDIVQSLEKENPTPAPRARARDRQANWLAYNRRVDVILGRESSVRYYPHKAEDSNILWPQPKPSLATVKRASE